ncbi:MAG: SDR family oxidoreductase [Jatrophihabitans sp.]|uniref:SDR family oxidoreductase n=1 Tax=Jatrophihabitans sp. TaxID=1932789 RepID=UPI0039126B14
MSDVLQDKVVVVAGVGPGLGRSIALQCAKAGADVVLAARTESRLGEVADEIKQLGRRTLQVGTDINSEESAQNLVDATLAEFGRLDALVNNAFAIPPLGALQTVDFEQVRAGFETNVLGGLRLTRLFVPALAESGGNVVMINSSVLRHSSMPYGAYKMAKSALLALAQALATELGPQGIRVNSVAPGYIWADTLQNYFAYLAKKRGVEAQVVYDETAANMDLRRLPDPDAIADAVVFLASTMARDITGHCLDVNCGEFHH